MAGFAAVGITIGTLFLFAGALLSKLTGVILVFSLDLLAAALMCWALGKHGPAPNATAPSPVSLPR